jgi:DNA-binding NtrC family response regulator
MRVFGRKHNLPVQPVIHTLPDQVRQQFGRIYMLESFSPTMGQVYKKMGKVLDSRVSLLFQGEVGTGKESLARIIHGAGKQCHGSFVAVQCQAPSEEQLEKELFGTRNGTLTTDGSWGKLGEADGGTIFLKNVDALSPTLQLRILRIQQDKAICHPGSYETRKINLRIIASTKRNLELEVNAGRFRQDLYFRLTVYQCDVPPLRERKRDIPKFVSFFVNKFANSTDDEPLVFTARALSQLEAYDWPGNICELKQVVLCSLMQMDKGNRAVDQIKWASGNVTSNLSYALPHGPETSEIESLMSKYREEAREQATFP